MKICKFSVQYFFKMAVFILLLEIIIYVFWLLFYSVASVSSYLNQRHIIIGCWFYSSNGVIRRHQHLATSLEGRRACSLSQCMSIQTVAQLPSDSL